MASTARGNLSKVIEMSERDLQMKHRADRQAAFDQVIEAIRLAGVALIISGSGPSFYAERSQLFEVLGLETSAPKAKRAIERFLAWERVRYLRLDRSDGSPPLEFISLEAVTERLAEFSSHPAMVAWKAAEQQRISEMYAWNTHHAEEDRARKRRLAPPTKKPLPFNVDALAATLDYYDVGEGGRRQPNPDESVDRWFMNEDGLSLYVRNGEILLEAWRHDLSDEEEDIPMSDPRWCEVNFRQITFPIPQTAEDALSQLIQVGEWPDDPGECEDFFLDYRDALPTQPDHVTQQGRRTPREPTL